MSRTPEGRIERPSAADQLALIRAKLTALFALLDIEEDSELTGRPFRPNQFTS